MQGSSQLFEGILEISNEKAIHQQDLEFLAKGVHKFVNGLSPTIMSDLFTISENPYNLTNYQALYSSNERTVVKFGMEL